MIYTVTGNPSLDYHVTVESLRPGKLHRAREERILPGGKGINVSMVLRGLGHDSCVLGFAGGFTGDELTCALSALGLNAHLVQSEGLTRVNVKIHGDVETEINGKGCNVTSNDFQELGKQLDAVLPGDALIVSGAPPLGQNDGFAARLLSGRAGVYTCADVSGRELDLVLRVCPFLIKPNRDELAQWMGHPLPTMEAVADAARAAAEAGARNVLVSLGAEGAFLRCEDGRLYAATAPRGEAVNTVGAGDAMLAGFVAGLLETGCFEQAFRLALAAGSAAAFAPWMPDGEAIRKIHTNLLNSSQELHFEWVY